MAASDESNPAALPPIPGGLDREVSFVSGFDSDGTLASPSFATWNGDTPATYSASAAQFKWGAGKAGQPGGTVTYRFAAASHWTAAERHVFVAGLTLWSDEADISFVPAAAGQSTDITIKRNTKAQSYESDSEPAHPVGTRHVSNPTDTTISIDSRSQFFGPIDQPYSSGAFPLSTVVHEEGHALGLGHTGPYNGGTIASTNAAQFGSYDQQLYSIMSYVPPWDTQAPFYPDYKIYAKFPNAETPMIADILAVQRIYGVPTDTALSGGQIFGFHCNIADASTAFFDFSVNQHPAVTLFDTGTGNTLDLSGFSSDSQVDLRPGHFSSCAGRTDNVAIAYGTAINTIICGAGNDEITGTTGNDTIVGGAGNDTMTGDGGHDRFVFHPASGRDVVTDFGASGPSRDTLVFTGQDFSSLADILRHTTMSQDNVIIHIDARDSVTLENVTKADLRAHPSDVAIG